VGIHQDGILVNRGQSTIEVVKEKRRDEREAMREVVRERQWGEREATRVCEREAARE
jgi:hypothetical protein